MVRIYTLKLHRDDRVGALFEAQLYRVSDDVEELVAEIDARTAPSASATCSIRSSTR